MSFLERVIRKGISKGVGDTIGKAVQQAVEPKATELANKAAEQIDQAAQVTVQQTQQTTQAASGLEGALGNLQRSVEGYVTEAAKNIKICPACGKPTTADKKFCQDCGTKLLAVVAEEQATQAKDAAVMAEWDEKLPQYPKWCFGGKDFNVEQCDGYIMFAVKMGNSFAAQNTVKQYRELLLQNGFRQAGQYPDPCHLYKMVDGTCCHCDTEHCFDNGSDCPTIYFNIGEPSGGFNYVKPEPKKPTNFKDFSNFNFRRRGL